MKANRVGLCLLSFFIIVSGCNNNGKEQAHTNDHKRKPESLHTEIQPNGKDRINNNLSSFVLSCGSGCAMTYTAESVAGTLPDIKVKFKVEMFVDEKLSDNYNEVYVFSYDQSNQIRQVHIEGKNDNVLKSLMPDAQQSFRDFANELVKNDIKGSSSTTQKLIYNQKTNPQNVVYKTIETSSVKGLNKYSCNEKRTRYLSLPDRSDIRLLLVPQDCGDFAYRYYLIAVKNNEVTGDLYVEGEWYEPDNEEDKEVRSFTIDDKYNITVKIQTKDSSTSEQYSIADNGTFVKR